MYDTGDLPKIAYRTKKVISSFKRNDFRIRQKIYSKLGNRRVKQFLNRVSKDIVSKARESNSMIVLEDIKGIRKLYRKGNGQGNKQHRQLWCSSCKRSMDRDVMASMNISYKGLQKFCNPSGLSEKVMKGNLGDVMPIILRVDGSKLGLKA